VRTPGAGRSAACVAVVLLRTLDDLSEKRASTLPTQRKSSRHDGCRPHQPVVDEGHWNTFAEFRYRCVLQVQMDVWLAGVAGVAHLSHNLALGHVVADRDAERACSQVRDEEVLTPCDFDHDVIARTTASIGPAGRGVGIAVVQRHDAAIGWGAHVATVREVVGRRPGRTAVRAATARDQQVVGPSFGR
jgi:hypothetical protein